MRLLPHCRIIHTSLPGISIHLCKVMILSSPPKSSSLYTSTSIASYTLVLYQIVGEEEHKLFATHQQSDFSGLSSVDSSCDSLVVGVTQRHGTTCSHTDASTHWIWGVGACKLFRLSPSALVLYRNMFYYFKIQFKDLMFSQKDDTNSMPCVRLLYWLVCK